MTLETLLILSVFHGFTYVNALRKDQVCFDTVFEAYSYVAFEGDDRDVYYYSLCQYPPKVLSIYAAGETYCTPSEVTAGAELLAAYCGEYGPDLQLLPISDFQANLTEENIQSIPVVTLEEAMAEATPYSTPVLISPSFFSAMHKTVVTWDYEIWTHRTYGLLKHSKKVRLNTDAVQVRNVRFLGVSSSHWHRQQCHQLVLFAPKNSRFDRRRE